MSKPRSIRSTIARALLPKLFVLALAFAWIAPSYLAPTWDVATDEEVMSIRPAVEMSPVALVDKDGCWTGQAPQDMQGVVPGHVVVTVDGVPRRGGSRLVGMALEQIFDGVDHGLVVHGFCR